LKENDAQANGQLHVRPRPDRSTFARAVAAELKPQKMEDTLAFMFETRLVIRPPASRSKPRHCNAITIRAARGSRRCSWAEGNPER
jgi:hypothetical protein